MQAGELLALLGPNGAGKSTRPALPGRARPDRHRVDRHRRTRRRRPGDRHARRARGSADRVRVPGLPAVRPHERARERRLRAARPRAHRRRTPAEPHASGSSGSASPSTRINGPGRCPAGRRNASRWPVRSRRTRGCCCSTSHWPRSTPARAASVRRDLRRHLETFDGMRSWSPTIRSTPTHWPIGSAILDAGRVVQVGTLAEVTAHPRSRYVADLVGVNLVAGNVDDGVLTTGVGRRCRDRRRRAGTVVRRHPAALGRHCRATAPTAQRPQHMDAARSPTSTGSAIACAIGIDGPLPLTAEITVAALEAWRCGPATTSRLGQGNRHRGLPRLSRRG